MRRRPVHKIWVVVRREFLTRVRTRWFVVTTVLGPLLMAGFIVVPFIVARQGGRPRTVAVVDVGTQGLGRRVEGFLGPPTPVRATRIAVEPARLASVTDSLTTLVGARALDGFLILTDSTAETGRAEYRGSNVASQLDMAVVSRAVREGVFSERLDRAGVDPSVVERARIPVAVATMAIRGGRATERSGKATFALAYAVWLLLYLGILIYGVQVMGSVVEEKSSRIVEVLISSLRPFQLLAGKVVGVGAVGLLQFAIWGLFARLIATRPAMLPGALGASGKGAGGFRIPQIPVGTILIFLVYFLLGYFLFAALFATVGAMSNTESEARQAQTPVAMLLVIPSMLVLAILQQPDGALAVALSLIPFCSPIAMPVRWAAAAVPPLQLGVSLLLLMGSLLVVIWLASRVYRVGILMYGKRPGIREVLRWMRA